MNLDISNHPLLNPDIEMNFWQECLRAAIVEVQSRWSPYKLGGHQGVTKSVYHKGPKDKSRSLILKAGTPPQSYCCGAVMEAWSIAWKSWMDGYGDQDMSAAQMKELRAHFFVYSREYYRGCAGGLLWLADQDPCSGFLGVEDIEDPTEAQFGDLCQIQFGRSAEDGHTVIILGTGKWKGRNVIHCWSSNQYYSDKWPHSKGQKPGHGMDFYYIAMTRDGFKRHFHIARIVDDDYESMPS